MNRKFLYTILFCTMMASATMAQINAGWTEEEVCTANTAATCPYMDQVEKDVVLYINLMRLYPDKFIDLEVTNSREKATLRALHDTINKKKPIIPLTISSQETEKAKKWANTMNETGKVQLEPYGFSELGISRKWGCHGSFYGAQNCNFGTNSGRQIVLDLLLDRHSVGDPRNPLEAFCTSIGVGVAPHPRYSYCCVVNFNDSKEEVFTPCGTRTSSELFITELPSKTEKSQPQPQSKPTQQQQQRLQSLEQRAQDLQKTQSKPAPEVVVVKKSSADKNSYTVQKDQPQDRSNSWLGRFYDYSGFSSLSYFSAGYTYSCMGGNHMISASILDFRVGMFGASILNMEMSVSPFNKRFSYKPNIRIYIPAAKCFSIVPYGGAEIDASYLGKYFDKNYTYDVQNDFYISAVGGLALNLTAARHVPMEIYAEYRHPVLVPTAGAINPKGFYVGAKIYLGSVFYKK